ncbi:MAG TPA: hypothetical protein PKG52_10820 [bacterium]|nr:hypothetical protein [bacterium]HPS31183.1 hypothetical protein [bacterium]
MKKTVLLIIASFFIFSCNDVHLTDPESVNVKSVISVKIEPPVVMPGEKIQISSAINSPDGVADISVGNVVFTATNSAELTIPSDISNLFGDSVRKEFTSKGFVDVPVNLLISGTEISAVKYFRIAGADYEKTKFDVNPAILSMTYEVIGSAEKIDIVEDSAIYFEPISIPEKISFEVSEIQIDDLIRDDYYFKWVVTGDAETYPELKDFDETTGTALFSFRDESGAPVFGDFRFHLIISPKKSYQGTKSARYGTDFFSFVISTKGEPLEEDDADNEVSD